LRYSHALRTHALLIFAVTVIALLAALAVVMTATKRYDAASDLQIQAVPAFGNADPYQGIDVFRQPADGSSAAVAAARLFSSHEYVDLLRRRLGTRANGVTVHVTPLSQADIVSLGASAPSAKLAAEAANRFASIVLAQRARLFRDAVAQRISDLRLQMKTIPAKYRAHSVIWQGLAANLSELRSLVGQTDPTVQLLTGATVPTAPAWPRPKLTLAIALAIGLLLGIAAAVTLELVNPRFTREDELTHSHRLPVLARIPRLDTRAVHEYSLGRGALPSLAWKSYRTLRAVLATAGEGGDRLPSSILVTSGGSGDGKTLTAVNLAIALSASGLRVTLVDGDIPRPMIATVFNVTGRRDGLVQLLKEPDGERNFLIRAPRHERLNLLLASPDQINQLHLFDPKRIGRMLARLREESDVIVIDSPPLPEVAEALSFADVSEAVMICVRIGHTRRDKLAELRDLLARRGVTPIGFFVTSRRRPLRRDAQYGYPVDLPTIPGDELLSRRDRLASADVS
jgi:Mrp family chromosome partitioning ATPase